MPRKSLVVLLFLCALRGFSEDTAPVSNRGSISGTVADVNGGIVPGATVVLRCQSPCNGESAITSTAGGFEFTELNLGTSYEIGVTASGFKGWNSTPIVLTPERSTVLTDVQMQLSDAADSVTVYASSEEIATEQVHIEERQRVLGFIPNFYVVYDSKNAVPLSAKLKFKLAMKVEFDPVTIAGIGFLAAIQQAGDSPNYVEGAKGYGQRFGADAATGFSDLLIGGAILPSVLHQDPRYFYQGTGTTASRLRHALLSPFICPGDNGRRQINFSSLGGDLASSALAQTYEPNSNQGPKFVFGGFAVGTGERMISAVFQEFLVRRLTPSARKQDY
jgi:hypothetical protein